MDRGSGTPRLVLRRLQSEQGPVAGRAPPVLFGSGLITGVVQAALLVDGGGVWEEWWSPSPAFYSFSCPDEGHVGGWVEGIREEARVE